MGAATVWIFYTLILGADIVIAPVPGSPEFASHDDCLTALYMAPEMERRAGVLCYPRPDFAPKTGSSGSVPKIKAEP